MNGMLSIELEKPIVAGKVNPGGSKSISNRILIMRALAHGHTEIENLSNSNDTHVLEKLLRENPPTWDVQDAGTAARFSAAFLAVQEGEEHILTGSERMRERPMKPLFDALRALGASIEYLEKQDYLPVKIKGKKLNGGRLSLPHDVSSQFVSALVMISPYLAGDLILDFDQIPFSIPYIQMTLNMLEEHAVDYYWDMNEEGGTYLCLLGKTPVLGKTYWVEPDWSSASYWYGAIALAEDGELLLENYRGIGLQGDELVVSLFDSLGVSSRFTEEGVWIMKTHKPVPDEFEFNFSDTPDLVPTLAVVLPLMGMKAHLKGLDTLRHKESDRVRIIAENLTALGVRCQISSDGNELEIWPVTSIHSDVCIACHQDHRMAMAFSLAALKADKIRLDTPEVVNKSYPNYWDDAKNVYKYSTFCFL